MQTERVLQAWIVKLCREYSILCYNFTAPSRAGVPDLLLIPRDGSAVFCEVKHPNGRGRVSKLQEVEIAKLRAWGQRVYLCHSKAHAVAMVADLGADLKPNHRKLLP